MDETRTHGVGELLQGIFRKQRRQPSLALQRLRQNWPGIVGEPLGRVTWPARIARGVLWITALDSGWAFNLQFVKADLLNAARTFLDSGEVSEIRYKVGELPPLQQSVPQPGEAPPIIVSSAAELLAVASSAPPADTQAEPETRTVVALQSQATPAPEAPASEAPSTIADPVLRKGFQRLAAKLLARRPKDLTPGPPTLPSPSRGEGNNSGLTPQPPLQGERGSLLPDSKDIRPSPHAVQQRRGEGQARAAGRGEDAAQRHPAPRNESADE